MSSTNHTLGSSDHNTGTKRLAIFAAYDKDKIIDDYVVYYLKELNKVADVIFVSDNEFLDHELEKIDGLTICHICKKHGEYDFGSYKRGYAWAKTQGVLEQYESLIFCNDSVYGPFYSLDSIFEKFEDDQSIDFWGMFLDRPSESTTYVQSYFTVFNKQIFQSSLFAEFMLNISGLQCKREIVREYEVGLSQLLIRSGYSPGGYFTGRKNEPHGKHIFKMVNRGFPFLKRSIFDIKSRVDGVRNAYRYASGYLCDFPVNYIDNHLKRVVDNQDLFYALNKRWNAIELEIMHRNFLKVSGGYLSDCRYRILVNLFGLRIAKIHLPQKWGFRSAK